MTTDILSKKVKRRRLKPFILTTSVKDLAKELGDVLPDENEVVKLISLYGGIASLSFIKLVADREAIEELTASTLRIGRKQFQYLTSMGATKKLKAARFFTSSMQKDVDAASAKASYNYAKQFETVCQKNGWKNLIVNNHSKIILMRTKNNYYVLETSSNLNENPKIEQYSFENNKELYDFYYSFFDALENRVLNE